MRLLFFFLLMIVLPIIQSCSTNSDGSTTLGMEGSPLWNEFAPKSDITNYYANMQVYELCLIWADNWHSRKIRKNIARALQAKGEDPLKCYNPSSDENKRMKVETEKLKNKLDAITTDLEYKCRSSGGSWYRSTCLQY